MSRSEYPNLSSWRLTKNRITGESIPIFNCPKCREQQLYFGPICRHCGKSVTEAMEEWINSVAIQTVSMVVLSPNYAPK